VKEENSTMTGTVTKQLAAYLSQAGSAELPEDVRVKASWHVLDTVAAGISGSRLHAGLRAYDYAAAAGHPGRSAIWGRGGATDAVMAAFVNAMASHADETDDSHARSVSHPGCSVVPAVFAVAGQRPTSGALVLRAVAAGYDLGTRMTMALGTDSFDLRASSRSSHAYASAFGAAGAGLAVAQLDPAQTEVGLSYTTQLASGVTTWLRDSDHVEKAFVFAGMPCRNGVFAVTIAQSGWENVPDAFDGHPNFLNAVSDHPQPEILTDGLGTNFELMQTNIKKYAVGSPAQAAVQAAEILIRDQGVTAAQIDAVEITLPAHAAHVTDNRAIPDINVQYLVAGTFEDGEFTFAMAHDVDRMTTPSILRLRGRTTIVPDESMGTARSATVAVTRTDGTVARVHVPFVRGTVDDPMSLDELERKSADLLEPALGKTRTRELISRLLDLDSVADVAELDPLLHGDAG
jgi:2-methylcitrate dehydratase PrpD